MKDKIALLIVKLPKLSAGDQVFANKLIDSYKMYGSLSAGKTPWVQKLIDRADNPEPTPVTIPLGNFSVVVALFNTAKEHLKWPKVSLVCSDMPIILSVAGPASKWPGSINVMGEGKYPDRPWYGQITPEGVWRPSHTALAQPEFLQVLTSLLVEFGLNPAGVAKAYGKLMGNCCFCGLKLTDPKSVAAGYGPICAEHYGLSAEYTKAWKRAESKETELETVFTYSTVVPTQSLAAVTYSTAVPIQYPTTYEVQLPMQSVPTYTVQAKLCFMCESEPATTAQGNFPLCKECAKELCPEKEVA